MLQVADLRRTVPYAPLGVGFFCFILVIAGLGVDEWSVLDCGSDYEFGWKSPKDSAAPNYSDCANSPSLPSGVCDDLEKGGKVGLAFGLLGLFSLAAALALYYAATHFEKDTYLKFSTVLFGFSTFFLMVSFAGWIGNGHKGVEDLADKNSGCDAKLGDTTNLIIASFVFMIFATSAAVYILIKGKLIGESAPITSDE